MRSTPRVLAIIEDRELLAKVDPILRRRSLEVHHMPSGASALVVTGNVHYDVIVVGAPLADLDLEDFVAALGSIDSTSSATSLLILEAEPLAASLRRTSKPELATLPSDSEPVEIHRALSDLLQVAARRASRLLVQIEVSLEGTDSLKILQTQNISRSGALLRGGRQLRIGESLRFQFKLPGDSVLIGGEAQVVRHTGRHEPVVGTAIRFLEISEEQSKRVAEFVHVGLARPLDPRAAAGG